MIRPSIEVQRVVTHKPYRPLTQDGTPRTVDEYTHYVVRVRGPKGGDVLTFETDRTSLERMLRLAMEDLEALRG